MRLHKGVCEWQAAFPLPLDGIGRKPCFWTNFGSSVTARRLGDLLAGRTRSLCGSPRLCCSSFPVTVSDSEIGARWGRAGMEALGQVTDGSGFVEQWTVSASQHVICIIHNSHNNVFAAQSESSGCLLSVCSSRACCGRPLRDQRSGGPFVYESAGPVLSMNLSHGEGCERNPFAMCQVPSREN